MGKGNGGFFLYPDLSWYYRLEASHTRAFLKLAYQTSPADHGKLSGFYQSLQQLQSLYVNIGFNNCLSLRPSHYGSINYDRKYIKTT